jgi:hypothetical protein
MPAKQIDREKASVCLCSAEELAQDVQQKDGDNEAQAEHQHGERATVRVCVSDRGKQSGSLSWSEGKRGQKESRMRMERRGDLHFQSGGVVSVERPASAVGHASLLGTARRASASMSMDWAQMHVVWEAQELSICKIAARMRRKRSLTPRRECGHRRLGSRRHRQSRCPCQHSCCSVREPSTTVSRAQASMSKHIS